MEFYVQCKLNLTNRKPWSELINLHNKTKKKKNTQNIYPLNNKLFDSSFYLIITINQCESKYVPIS